MSRTYRRLTGDMGHRNWIARAYVITEGYHSRMVRHVGPPTREMIRGFVRFHMDGSRTMGQTPSWHWHDTTTVPARREERDLCKKILRLADLEDAPLFPTRKRPKEWFW
jgi:hypothetical protein